MIVKSVLSHTGLWLSPWRSLRDAAAVMRDQNIAALPIKAEGQPLGLVTDHDIVVRLLPDARDIGTRPVRDAMTRHPVTCFADQDITQAAALMGDAQVRHLLVLDRSGGLVGVLSVDDIAKNASEELAGQILGEIVEARA